MDGVGSPPPGARRVTKASQQDGRLVRGRGSPLGGVGGSCAAQPLLQQSIQAPSPGQGGGCGFPSAPSGLRGWRCHPGPPERPGCPAHVTVQRARGTGAGRPGSPELLPANSSEAAATLSARGQFPRRWGRGGGVASPLPASASAQPLLGAQVLAPVSQARSRSAATSGQARHFPGPLCPSLRKEHLIKNASGAPRLSLCHTHSSGPGHPRGG